MKEAYGLVLIELVDIAIVTAMNDVAHSLGRSSVTEYVESAEVFRLLKICGIDKVQGYYISRPLKELSHGNVIKFQLPKKVSFGSKSF